MKISCTQENLNLGLSVVGKITGSKTTLPILSNILLKTEKGRLKLSSTDLEIGVNCFVGGKIEKEGSITVPAKVFIDYILMNDDKKIDLETEKNDLILKSQRYKARIKGIDPSEYPQIPEIKKEPLCSFFKNKLKEAISQVIIAPSLDETRPVLTGIYLRFFSKEVKMVATDSFRLAEKTLTIPSNIEKKEEIILPARTLQELNRILGLVDVKEVSISILENQVLFTLDDIQLISRVIEGNFPDYEAIIPKNTETEAVLSVSDFQNTLKMANLFAKESGNNVKLKLEKDNLRVEATSPLLGENTSFIPAKIEGPKTEISFNAEFLLDFLQVLSSSKITLGVSGKLNPGILRPEGNRDYLYLIMPLRTEE